MSEGTPIELSGLVVHWRNEEELAALVRAWPWDDPRFELVVVDNGSDAPLPEGPYRLFTPQAPEAGPGAGQRAATANLGFAGGVNLAAARARGRRLLLLNPDAHPEPGALEALLAAFEAHPEAAGFAPRLVGDDGASQHDWQLARLPGPLRLVGHTLGLQSLAWGALRRPAAEPPSGTPVEQPAAAALALTRSAFEAAGGMDEGFYPAWFEDVDLARRLADLPGGGGDLRYLPEAVFRHARGASVPRLGYGPFQWIYYRNLVRYLTKHHGPVWAAAARDGLVLGTLLRLAQLPVRRPKRAASRREAAAGALGVLAGVLSGWRFPRAWRRRFSRPAGPGSASGGAP